MKDSEKKSDKKSENKFSEEYKKLNKFQKEAIDSIDGPVMVVAGPGTGKTQILALRIANILTKTDVKPDGILCLTFTNSAVEAMGERLFRYIGEASKDVNVFTFHSFGMKLIEKYFSIIDLLTPPKLLEDTDAAIFFHEILEGNDWEYLRPRGDAGKYYKDLKSLISLLKRERIGREEFLREVKKEIKKLEESDESLSTRGESKGQLKKDVLATLESLKRTREVAQFIEIYEKAKKEKNVLDYDDVLENLVKIVEKSKDALADVREQYLYVLVDEHQDSSRVQNEFLKIVWSKVERPDIFVVGDDRQLIYGFSGASIDHFAGFKKTFPAARLITLVENYRSTQVILDVSHMLLRSVLSDEKLKSQSKDSHPIILLEAQSSYSEILAAAEDIKAKIKESVDADECAILVPKNSQVREALKILHREGLPIAPLDALDLFDQPQVHQLIRVLKIINSSDKPALALSIFDRLAPLEAHKFFTGINMREFSLESFLHENPRTLFADGVGEWRSKISQWLKMKEKDLGVLIKIIGEEIFQREGSGLVRGEDITNTICGLLEKNTEMTLSQFVEYLERLESYGESVPILMKASKGVKVITMHSSKGLEFDYVWVAHMDEWSLTGSRRAGFALPESIGERVEERDVDAIKRKLYVAITRAKRFCTLSYSTYSRKGAEQKLARVIDELPKEVFIKRSHENAAEENSTVDLTELKKLVTEQYPDRYISASLLNNFFECPWRWYFQNLLRLPSDSAPVLEFGIAMHSCLDQILKRATALSDAELEKLIAETVQNKKWHREMSAILKKWIKNRFPEIKLSRRTEEPISATDKKFPHLKMYGKIDLIENLGPKEVRVTDFKTGKAKRKSEIEKRDDEGRMTGNLRQLAMYSYLLSNNPKWDTDARESRLEFVEAKDGNDLYDRVITPADIELLVKDIADYDNLIKSGEWTNRPCNYNSYGKNTECEYCKMAEIYKN